MVSSPILLRSFVWIRFIVLNERSTEAVLTGMQSMASVSVRNCSYPTFACSTSSDGLQVFPDAEDAHTDR
jgi:hypothetical protein